MTQHVVVVEFIVDCDSAEDADALMSGALDNMVGDDIKSYSIEETREL